MLDLTTEQGRFISAALALAAERPWPDITLSDIAERAGSSLVALKAHFSSKGEILGAFVRLVDDEVLGRAPRRTEGQSARDTLFEVIMSRFDVLEPYKAALKSIAAGGLPELSQIGPVIASQRWMLEAAGIGSAGLDGGVRTAGLASVYASVFRIWLDDTEAGLARTMAALDRRLRRGERTLRQVESTVKGVGRIGDALADAIRTFGRRACGARRASDPTSPPPGPVPSAPPPTA